MRTDTLSFQEGARRKEKESERDHCTSERAAPRGKKLHRKHYFFHRETIER
jgi:hypothetical protein